MLTWAIKLLVTLIVAILGVQSTAGWAVPSTPSQAHAYPYDSAHNTALSAYATTERGPPAVDDLGTTYDAVDPWSPGALARPDTALARFDNAYDDVARLAPVAAAGTTTQEQVRRSGGGLSSVSLGQVAARDVPTVVFDRSRAPGLASNFDNAVANGAPTRLTRVDAAARDANRRAALRGQPPAPAR